MCNDEKFGAGFVTLSIHFDQPPKSDTSAIERFTQLRVEAALLMARQWVNTSYGNHAIIVDGESNQTMSIRWTRDEQQWVLEEIVEPGL